MGRLRDRLRALLHRDAVLRDIDDEMRSHLELQAEANRRRGLEPGEARRAAERDFGNLGAARDAAYDVRGGGMLESFWQDLRFGARVLRKSPGVTLTAVLTWALGIGATVAVFSVIKPVLLSALPFPAPERMVAVHEMAPPRFPSFSVASGNFAEFPARGGPFEELVAMRERGLVLIGGGDPMRLRGLRVTDGFFALYGLRPVLGRAFSPEEDQPGKELVTVLSNGLWQRRFGGDPDVIGRTLTLDDRAYTVVGVMPPELHASLGEVDLWLPMAFTADERKNHGGHSLRVVGRLAPGVTVAAARDALDVIEHRITESSPANQGWSSKIDPLADQLVGDVRPSLILLAIAVAFVLLIACANVASLLLGRASVRQREVAVRAALGAGRGRIVRQLATESLLLSVLGGGVGLLLATWGVDLLLRLAPDGLAGLKQVRLDWPLVAFTSLASVVTGVVVGLAPALQTARVDLHAALKDGGRTSTGGRGQARARRGLIVVEVAACLLLVVGAGLLVRSLGRLLAVDPGVDPTNVAIVGIDLPRTRYADGPSRLAFFTRAIEEVAALPGVAGVAAAQTVPFASDLIFSFDVVGRPPSPEGKQPWANFYFVTPDYFRVMGIPLRSGRAFTTADRADVPDVFLINETMERRLFPDGGAIGSRITTDSGKTWAEIIGVVGDVKQYGLADETTNQVYTPYAQTTTPAMLLTIRSAGGDPTLLMPGIRARVATIDPNQPVGAMRSLSALVDNSLARQRFSVALLSIFAGVALLMAVIGIYGVISDTVTQRTHEIGVRMALGARRGTVLRLMMAQGLWPALAGAVLGLVGALAATRFLSSMLFGVGATDPITMGAAVALILGVALLASYLPARRATRIDPMVALRVD